MTSTGQGHLSKKERKGIHPDRRNKIAGENSKWEEATLVGEDAGDDATVVEENGNAAEEEVAAKANFAGSSDVATAREAVV